MVQRDASGFEAFASDARPRLVRALIPVRGDDAVDGAAEALAFAREHWSEGARLTSSQRPPVERARSTVTGQSREVGADQDVR